MYGAVCVLEKHATSILLLPSKCCQLMEKQDFFFCRNVYLSFLLQGLVRPPHRLLLAHVHSDKFGFVSQAVSVCCASKSSCLIRLVTKSPDLACLVLTGMRFQTFTGEL